MVIAKAENVREDIPLVSIVAICYNQSKYVIETLDSIIAQTYSNIQLIIIDDCSTDNSIEIINKWIRHCYINCDFVKHSKNLGISKSCNDGLQRVKGNYYQIISCDDIIFSDKIEKQVAQLERNGKAAVIFSDAILMNEDSKWLYEGPRFIQRNRLIFETLGENIFYELISKNFIPAPSVLIRTRMVNKIDNYDESISFEDWDLWLRLSENNDFLFYKKPTALYRVHSSNLTHILQTNIHLHSRFLLLYKHVNKSQEINEILETQLYEILKKLFYNNYREIKKISKMYYDCFSNDLVLKICIKLPFYNYITYKFACKINKMYKSLLTT